MVPRVLPVRLSVIQTQQQSKTQWEKPAFAKGRLLHGPDLTQKGLVELTGTKL